MGIFFTHLLKFFNPWTIVAIIMMIMIFVSEYKSENTLSNILLIAMMVIYIILLRVINKDE